VANTFFEQVAREVDPEVHVVVFRDQAGFHTAKALGPPPDLTLIPLPPYCPGLNPSRTSGTTCAATTGPTGPIRIMTNRVPVLAMRGTAPA
jgi:hypothetical protein